MDLAVALRDRLPALKESGSRYSSSSFQSLNADADPVIEENVKQVLHNVDEINFLITEIIERSERLKSNHTIILSSLQSQDARDDNEQINKEIKRLSHSAHGLLKRMKDSIDNDHVDRQQFADYRIKATQYAALSRRFKNAMGEYTNAQERFREKNKECIERQLLYAEKSLSNEQVEAIMDSNDAGIFAKNIILDTEEKKQALGEVEARCRDILKLEEDMKALHQMFYDLAVVVNEQGEMVNQIEANIDSAADWVYEGAGHIKKCVDIANQRPKICCCCW